MRGTMISECCAKARTRVRTGPERSDGRILADGGGVSDKPPPPALGLRADALQTRSEMVWRREAQAVDGCSVATLRFHAPLRTGSCIRARSFERRHPAFSRLAARLALTLARSLIAPQRGFAGGEMAQRRTSRPFIENRPIDLGRRH